MTTPWRLEMYRSLAFALPLAFVAFAQESSARQPYREGYYDNLSSGRIEDFLPVVLLAFFTFILGRRDNK
jgi:hypothetical protein